MVIDPHAAGLPSLCGGGLHAVPEAAGRHEVKVAPKRLQGRFPGKVTSGGYILCCRRLSRALASITCLFITERRAFASPTGPQRS